METLTSSRYTKERARVRRESGFQLSKSLLEWRTATMRAMISSRGIAFGASRKIIKKKEKRKKK